MHSYQDTDYIFSLENNFTFKINELFRMLLPYA